MPGIHHVTAISGDPVKNLRFYTRDLGLRFVKKTVNFDDPSIYRFYFGDETGCPGTILTFFPWTNATAGQRGVGQASQTAFRVPLRSISYWTERFIERGFLSNAAETFRHRRCGEREPAGAAGTSLPNMIRGFRHDPCCSTTRRDNRDRPMYLASARLPVKDR
jgi:catechol 2,3-dioxygenase-like lactoylglutathione lyase family enzyme